MNSRYYRPFRISFLLRSVYDTLPTPTNLHSKTVLIQRRYIMAPQQDPQNTGWNLGEETSHPPKDSRNHSVHQRRGKTTTFQENQHLLQTAQSWEMRVDLGGKLHFSQVVQISLMTVLVIWPKCYIAKIKRRFKQKFIHETVPRYFMYEFFKTTNH